MTFTFFLTGHKEPLGGRGYFFYYSEKTFKKFQWETGFGKHRKHHTIDFIG